LALELVFAALEDVPAGLELLGALLDAGEAAEDVGPGALRGALDAPAICAATVALNCPDMLSRVNLWEKLSTLNWGFAGSLVASEVNRMK
jgi:hypothetical protein